jgi:hypothetical protein
MARNKVDFSSCSVQMTVSYYTYQPWRKSTKSSPGTGRCCEGHSRVVNTELVPTNLHEKGRKLFYYFSLHHVSD